MQPLTLKFQGTSKLSFTLTGSKGAKTINATISEGKLSDVVNKINAETQILEYQLRWIVQLAGLHSLKHRAGKLR